VTINNNAQITLNANLSSCGNIVGGTTTAANILGSTGHLIMSGSSRQTVSGVLNMNIWEVNNTGSGIAVDATGKVTINKELLMTRGDIQDDGSVTLISNASGDAYLDDFTSSTAGVYYYPLTVQRYVSNTVDGYRDISSPVNGLISDLNNAYSVFGQNGVDCYYAYSPYPNVQLFNESLSIPAAAGSFNEHWVSYTTLTNPMPALTGLAFRTYVGAPYTINFTGTPYNGTQTRSITNSTDGWNFIGNPYPSPVKWTAIKALNPSVNGTYYVGHATGEYTGNWSSFNGTTGVNGATDDIAIGQGFFVLATSNTTFTMNNTVRTGTSGTFFGPSRSSLDNEIRLYLTNGANSDEIVTYTDPQATNGFDPEYDAVKIPAGSTVNIGYRMAGHDYAINVMNSIDSQTILPLSVYVSDSGSYSLTATSVNVTGMKAYLRDARTGTMTDLTAGVISLTLAGGQTDSTSYSIVFKTLPSTSTGIVTLNEETAPHIYSSGNTVYVKRQNATEATIMVSNVLGQEVKELSTSTEQTTFELPANQPWYAIVKVTEGEKVSVAKVLISNK
jgi:hypothetical protein